jgi:hypothetical protein
VNTTAIAWTDKTDNWQAGCSDDGPECRYCYARVMSRRVQGRATGASTHVVQLLHPAAMERPVKPTPDLGILMMPTMVRAILAGQKTVTRRALTVPWAKRSRCQPYEPYWTDSDGVLMHADEYGDWHVYGPEFCRYRPGRRLWVRETWRTLEQDDGTDGVFFPADGAFVPIANTPEAAELWGAAHANGKHGHYRPSLLMPRWASRLTLLVTDVRAERLTEITPEDVRLEGFVHAGLGDTPSDYCRVYREMHKLVDDANPWLWRIAFEVVDPDPRAYRADFTPYQRPVEK